MSSSSEAQRRNEEHMEQVRAVMRRSSYERVLGKIAYYEAWERAVTEGIRLGRHEPDDPPLSENDRATLGHLRELCDAIRQEMIEAGQISIADHAE